MGTNMTRDEYEELALNWGPIIFRLAPILAGYWVAQGNFLFTKFTNPQMVAGALGGMGSPNPIWLIYLIGIIELAFIVTALVGFYARIFGSILLVEMLFAWFYGGANPQLMTLVLSSYFIIVFGTGAWSIRDPTWPEIYESVLG